MSTLKVNKVESKGSGGDAQHLEFATNGSTQMTVLSTGNVGIGTDDPKTPLHIISTNTLGATFSGATHGEGITITQSDYTASNYVSLLEGSYDDSSLPPCVRIGAKFTGGGSDLVFGTSNNFASGITNQAVTIDSGGNVGIGTTSPGGIFAINDWHATGSTKGLVYYVHDGDNEFIARSSIDVSSNRHHYQFMNTNGTVGSIGTNGSATAFNTSSDYRLKENLVEIDDAIGLLDQLSPYRFNFKVDPTTTVLGFLAHEVAEVVPEAVSGDKDAVDKEGKIDPQGIDQGKLVPLLTAALQETLAKVESLETRIEQLEA